MLSVDIHRSALFLDLDGTLIDIGTTPHDVVVPVGLVTTLSTLVDRFNGAVAIVTGRPIHDADQLLLPLQLVTAGVHGIQLRRTRGGAIETAAPMLPRELLRAIQAVAANFEGIVVEPKGAAVAVHYRMAPASRSAIEHALIGLVESYGQHLTLSHGRMVYEVMPRVYSKGGAIRVLMQLADFRGRKPIMIGDDAPDVSAQNVAIEMGGSGLRVCGEYFAAACSDFANPVEVRRWLAGVLELGR